MGSLPLAQLPETAVKGSLLLITSEPEGRGRYQPQTSVTEVEGSILRNRPQHYGSYSIFYDARADVRGKTQLFRNLGLDRPVLAKNQNGEVAAQFSSAVSLVLFCCSSPSSSVRPSLSSCSVVRRRPVQFGRLSRLVLLFVAVQFSSAVSLVLFCCSSPYSSVRPSL